MPANSLSEADYLLEADGDRVGALHVSPSPQSPDAPSASDLRSQGYIVQAAEAVESGLPVPAQLLDGALHDTRPGPGLTEGRLPSVSGLTLVSCSQSASRTRRYADLAEAIRACIARASVPTCKSSSPAWCSTSS